MIAIWDARFSVGDALADAEHRLVIGILNEIDVARSVGAPPEVLGTTLDTLVRTIDAHFARHGALRGDHLAIAASARRLLVSWQDGLPDALERRVLVNLAHRWIGHMGRQETSSPTRRMVG